MIERTRAPEGLPEDGIAIQCRTAGSPLDWLDRAVFFCPKPNGVDASILGRFAFVQIKDGPACMASVRRGYLDNTYNLIGPHTRENVRLVAATPVLSSRH